MRKVELLGGRSDIRKFYPQVKRQKEGYALPTSFCNDATGNLLVNDDDVLEIWREYFAELLGSFRLPLSTFPEDMVNSRNVSV